jgi:Zn-dependent protease with chaperone function
MDLLVLVPLAFIWAVLPDAGALIAQWLSGYFTKVLFQLPFSRALEAEADQIGLQLTAKVGARRLGSRLLFFLSA